MSKSLQDQAREILEGKQQQLNEADFEFYLDDIVGKDPQDFVNAVSKHFERSLVKYAQALNELYLAESDRDAEKAHVNAVRAIDQLDDKCSAVNERLERIAKNAATDKYEEFQ